MPGRAPDGYRPSVWLGDWIGESVRPQGGLLAPTVGLTAVISGSYSGEIRGIAITEVDDYINGFGPFFIGQRTSVGGAAGKGDSGGPYHRGSAIAR